MVPRVSLAEVIAALSPEKLAALRVAIAVLSSDNLPRSVYSTLAPGERAARRLSRMVSKRVDAPAAFEVAAGLTADELVLVRRALR